MRAIHARRLYSSIYRPGTITRHRTYFSVSHVLIKDEKLGIKGIAPGEMHNFDLLYYMVVSVSIMPRVNKKFVGALVEKQNPFL